MSKEAYDLAFQIGEVVNSETFEEIDKMINIEGCTTIGFDQAYYRDKPYLLANLCDWNGKAKKKVLFLGILPIKPNHTFFAEAFYAFLHSKP